MDEQRVILVVEDDEPTRSFLLENLAADGFRVAGATSAAEALRAIEVRQPALVVLDLRPRSPDPPLPTWTRGWRVRRPPA